MLPRHVIGRRCAIAFWATMKELTAARAGAIAQPLVARPSVLRCQEALEGLIRVIAERGIGQHLPRVWQNRDHDSYWGRGNDGENAAPPQVVTIVHVVIVHRQPV